MRRASDVKGNAKLEGSQPVLPILGEWVYQSAGGAGAYTIEALEDGNLKYSENEYHGILQQQDDGRYEIKVLHGCK